MQGLPDAAQPRDTPTRVPATAPGSKCASPATALGTGLPHRRPQLRRAFRCFSFILLVRAVCPQLFTALAGSPPRPLSPLRHLSALTCGGGGGGGRGSCVRRSAAASRGPGGGGRRVARLTAHRLAANSDIRRRILNWRANVARMAAGADSCISTIGGAANRGPEPRPGRAAACGAAFAQCVAKGGTRQRAPRRRCAWQTVWTSAAGAAWRQQRRRQ